MSCTCVDTSVVTLRLVNGSKPSEGRVEVLHNGVWGTVCSRRADFYVAQVVCRQLGYRVTIGIKTNAYFGEGSGPVWMEPRYGCSLRKRIAKTLPDCIKPRRIPNWGRTKCNHSQDLGVVCSS